MNLNNEQVGSLVKMAEDLLILDVCSTEFSERWLRSFAEDCIKNSKIDLFSKVITEVKNRGVSINHLFMAYVYSQDDNIQYNLDFLDYLVKSHKNLLDEVVHVFGTGASIKIKEIRNTFKKDSNQ